MTDILETIDQAAESDTATDWMKGVLWQAAAEIARLRGENAELTRRSQKAEAAARDTYVEARRRGVSAGRILANYMAGRWRDLAVVLADEMAYQTAGGDDDAHGEDHIDRMVGPGVFISMVTRLLTDGETLNNEAYKARSRIKDSQQINAVIPQFDIHAPILPVKPPRKPMTKDDLARAMYELAHGWDSLGHEQRQQWIKAAEGAIRKEARDRLP